MKERIIAIVLLILAGLTVWAIATELPRKEYARPAVSNDVIRLHILADSDTDRDQAVKLALRDVLLPYLNAATLDAKTKQEALVQLEAQCPALTAIANAVLAQLGADYTATITVDNLYFPIRIYGSQTYLSEDAVIFPPGFYDSVQVVLGRGEGHNWWCLAYPSLCFIDSSYSYVPKDSEIYKLKIGTMQTSSLEQLFYGESLSELLPQEFERETVILDSADKEEITVCFGSKLWELLKNWFHKNAK